jgi:ArsR family transcriptional regulator
MVEKGKKNRRFDVVTLFRALADRTRLRLLNLMGDGEVCVCFFVEVLESSQPKISRHLAYLRRAGIVATRREGKWMHYRIVEPADPFSAGLLRDTLGWMTSDPEMRRDRSRLLRVCCGPQAPGQLQGAPRPISLTAP